MATKCVLLVDDDSYHREPIQIALETAGYEVHPAANGKEALKQLEEREFDLILSDLKMPVMSGMELLQAVRTQYPAIPFLMITAHGSVENAVAAMKLGARDYITKPIQLDELELKVKRELEVRAKDTEIRNPLGGIAAYAALLERDLEVEDPRRRLVQEITAGVGRLNRIVSSLLSYTRPLNLNTYPADLVAVVEEAAAFFEIELERHHRGVALNRRYPTVGLVCPLDPEQFQQVVLNLLQNATQAMPGGGTIDLEISTRHEADESQAVLCVRDAGVGMTVEVQEKLFTPFFTTKEDGTGLGLVTSKKIVDAHGGHIHVESRPGDGTSFTIHLPQ
jgi:signal transduction histidine kinase